MVRFAPARQISVKFTGKEAEAIMKAADWYQDAALEKYGRQDPDLQRAMRKVGGELVRICTVGKLRREAL